jgi:hypothetical protein
MAIKLKNSVTLLDDGKIEIQADSRTIVTRAVNDSDREQWPELFEDEKKAPKKKRPVKPKTVKTPDPAVDDESQGYDKPGD